MITSAASELVFQRNGRLLVTPGDNRPEIASDVRLCGQLEKIIADSYLFALSRVAIWGSAARGVSAETILQRLEEHTATPIPAPVAGQIAETHGRYGAIWTEPDDAGAVRLCARDRSILPAFGLQHGARVKRSELSDVKRRLAIEGWPITEREPAINHGRLAIELRAETVLRPYQAQAVRAHDAAGHGLVLLPCGAGKTMIGIGAMCSTSGPTLILTPSREVALQWERAILGSTTAAPDAIATLPTEDPRPITIATYQAATGGRIGPALVARPWSLIIFDEVQSLPANVFRTVAALSTERRLGLSATLVREDGREAEIFAMVGPVVYDLPWIELEREGWIAAARCFEVRIPAAGTPRERARYKHAVIERLLESAGARPTLVVGSNVQSLAEVASRFALPLLTGKDDADRRAKLFDAFRAGEIKQLAVSRIGSTGLDLPTAEVMIQVNGNFGSRQEEAQRLGRLLRPGNGQDVDFYSLVSLDTREPDYARRRQRFLVDQGYEYQIVDAADLPRVARA